MPAPQSAQYKQLARSTFAGFNIKVPVGWSDPSGQDGDQYGNAFKPEDKSSSPVAGLALFQPHTMFKWQTDVQKGLHSKFGTYIDGISDAICSAWSQWQSLASMAGALIIPGGMVTVGQIIGPPMMPLILESAPKGTAMEAAYSLAIATAINTGWLAYTATIKLNQQAFYPAFTAPVPIPASPPTPNVPFPISSCIQVSESISKDALKGLMLASFPNPTAPHAPQLFEAVADAFEKSYDQWQNTTMITNCLGIGMGPGTPITPAPFVSGTAIMAPGGLQ